MERNSGAQGISGPGSLNRHGLGKVSRGGASAPGRDALRGGNASGDWASIPGHVHDRRRKWISGRRPIWAGDLGRPGSQVVGPSHPPDEAVPAGDGPTPLQVAFRDGRVGGQVRFGPLNPLEWLAGRRVPSTHVGRHISHISSNPRDVHVKCRTADGRLAAGTPTGERVAAIWDILDCVRTSGRRLWAAT